jgi:hypothetical protein
MTCPRYLYHMFPGQVSVSGQQIDPKCQFPIHRWQNAEIYVPLMGPLRTLGGWKTTSTAGDAVDVFIGTKQQEKMHPA